MLELQLLGSPQIIADGNPIGGVAWVKSQALLFYLALHERPLSRLHLAGLLWPEKSDEEARTNLRQALRTLTKALPNLIDSRNDSLTLDRSIGIQIDVPAFEAEAQAGLAGEIEALRSAAKRYRGDLLAGFFVEEAPDFEEWLHAERTRLHGLALQVLHQLTTHHMQRREIGPAMRYAQQTLALDPWREETHQQLMRLLAWDGQYSAALAQYEICRRVLDRELGIAPAPETDALRDRIVYLRSARRHNLPPEPTPLVGRDEVLAQLYQLLQQAGTRLVTILGPGGVGKTRLALAAARRLANVFLEGVFWVDLAPVSTPDGLVAALAAAFQLNLAGKGEPQRQLLDYLRDKEMLLVLDNFEHLLADDQPGGSDLIHRILAEAPAVSPLVTSRVRLDLRQEQAMPLGPLSYPPGAGMPGSEDYEAVRLFLQVAQRVGRPIDMAAELSAVVTICQLVEGLPLGVELAAALVQSWPCATIAEAIIATIDSLAVRWRDLPARQRSLRATYDYSVSLLPEAARDLLARLTVFQDGFTHEAAEVVAQATPALLNMLIAHSLLRRTGQRYALHEVIRQYARAALTERPAEAAAVQQAHSTYFAGQVAEREAHLRRSDPLGAQGWFIAEQRNIVAGWRWAIAQDDLALLDRSLGGLMLYYQRNGPFRGGEQLIEEALARVQADPLRARLLIEQGELLEFQGRYPEALAVASAALGLGEALGDDMLQARAHLTISKVLHAQGSFDLAIEHARATQRLAAPAGRPLLIAAGQVQEGLTAIQRGQPERATALFNAALVHYREQGDLSGMAATTNQLGMTLIDRNDLAAAQAAFNESLALDRQLGDRKGEISALINLGIIHDYFGEYDRSRSSYSAALDQAQELGSRDLRFSAMTNLGLALQLVGDYTAANSYYQQVLQGLRSESGHHQEGLLLANLALLAHQTGDQPGAKAYSEEVLRAAGSLDSAFLRSYGLTFLAHAEAALGSFDVAATAYTEAVSIRREMQATNMALESLAGLARVRLAQHQPRAALAHIEEILPYLEAHPQVEGTDEPLRLYLTCYEVLQANRDPRATTILATAYQLLQVRATHIGDAQLRDSFLHKIETHRRLLDAYRQ